MGFGNIKALWAAWSSGSFNCILQALGVTSFFNDSRMLYAATSHNITRRSEHGVHRKTDVHVYSSALSIKRPHHIALLATPHTILGIARKSSNSLQALLRSRTANTRLRSGLSLGADPTWRRSAAVWCGHAAGLGMACERAPYKPAEAVRLGPRCRRRAWLVDRAVDHGLMKGGPLDRWIECVVEGVG